MFSKATVTTSAMLAAQLVSGHSLMWGVTGDQGGFGLGLGVDTSIPRNCISVVPCQLDAGRFRTVSSRTSFGDTLGNGPNDLETDASAILSATGKDFPKVTPGGTLNITMHQVNADGAGPYRCMLNSDGTGQSWTELQITKNIAGNARTGINVQTMRTDAPLLVTLPSDLNLTGKFVGRERMGLVRCQNPAAAGPFGGAAPIQQVDGKKQKRSNLVDVEMTLEKRKWYNIPDDELSGAFPTSPKTPGSPVVFNAVEDPVPN